jgi:endonuclease/exonuclease/phosphatase family metal-dependent hydrolase
MKIISWNMANRVHSWEYLKSADADIALLQEARQPTTEVLSHFNVDQAPWHTEGIEQRPWRTAIVGLRSNIQIERIQTCPLIGSDNNNLKVSQMGTLAIARVRTSATSEWITLVSMYAIWEKLHSNAGRNWIISDASAHRLISDISALIGKVNVSRLIVAGDLNILYGYGEHGSRYWAGRFQTIFNRFAAIGLPFVGPQSVEPEFHNGRQAQPWPDELPPTSHNVPTYHSNRQKPLTATRQLDFVFASRDLKDKITVKALNRIENWGPSDHCQIEIDVSSDI